MNEHHHKGQVENMQLVAAIEHEIDQMVRDGRHAAKRRADLISSTLPQLGYSVLLILAQSGPQSQNEVATTLATDKSAVSKAVRHLLDEQLITQEQSHTDRRQRLLTVTAEGKARVTRALSSRRADIAARLEEWGPEKLAEFREMLRLYNAATPASDRDEAAASTAAGAAAHAEAHAAAKN